LVNVSPDKYSTSKITREDKSIDARFVMFKLAREHIDYLLENVPGAKEAWEKPKEEKPAEKEKSEESKYWEPHPP
jgi:hypothetical protein